MKPSSYRTLRVRAGQVLQIPRGEVEGDADVATGIDVVHLRIDVDPEERLKARASLVSDAAGAADPAAIIEGLISPTLADVARRDEDALGGVLRDKGAGIDLPGASPGDSRVGAIKGVVDHAAWRLDSSWSAHPQARCPRRVEATR